LLQQLLLEFGARRQIDVLLDGACLDRAQALFKLLTGDDFIIDDRDDGIHQLRLTGSLIFYRGSLGCGCTLALDWALRCSRRA